VSSSAWTEAASAPSQPPPPDRDSQAGTRSPAPRATRDSVATSLAALLDDPERRARLGEAAVARAGEFTWAASAEAHLSAYARAAGVQP
jgi:hypothetical protein